MSSPYADDPERLYPAPRNSLGGPPPGVPRKGDGRIGNGQLVVVRLVWPRCVELVPGRVEWLAGDRVLVEWQRGRTVRKSWLHRDDVKAGARWVRSGPDEWVEAEV